MRDEITEWEVDSSDIKSRYLSIPIPNYAFEILTERLPKEITARTGGAMPKDQFLSDIVRAGMEAWLRNLNIKLVDHELEKEEQELI